MLFRLLSFIALISNTYLAVANDAPWIVRTGPLERLNTLTQSDSTAKIIYRFLNDDVLIASTSPVTLTSHASNIQYMEIAAKLEQNDIVPFARSSSISIQDHLTNDGIRDLPSNQRQCDLIKIAVIDSGADLEHSGWGTTTFERAWDTITENSSIYDRYGHGTHVTGIISSSFNSELGYVEGACQSATIIPIKFLSDYGSGTIIDSIEAVQWAIDSQADIINHSWITTSNSIALRDVLSDANQRGILQIAAAGNNGSNNDNASLYPVNYASNLSGMISVANWDNSTNRLHTTSNFGFTTIDLAASGTNILSLTPNNNVAALSGTSMAAPIVTSVAAMIAQQTPEYSAADIRAKLKQSVILEPSLNAKVMTQGRLDAQSAMSAALETPHINNLAISALRIKIEGVFLDKINHWQFRPAIVGSPTISLSIAESDARAVEIIYKELPHGYFEGYIDDQLFTSFPYTPEQHPPSELALTKYQDTLILQWRGSIYAHSYEIENFENGRFVPLATVEAPSNQLSITTVTDSTQRFRVRAQYHYQMDGQQLTSIYSDFSQEITTTPNTDELDVRGFAKVPQGTSTTLLIDLDTRQNYDLISDPDNKVIALQGNQVVLDSSEVGQWQFVVANNDTQNTLSFEVISDNVWALNTTQGATLQFTTSQAEINGVTEFDERKIAITATPLQSPFLLSISLVDDSYNFADVEVSALSASHDWSVVSQSTTQLNLRVNGTEPTTIVIQPKINHLAMESSASSDSRCFIASSVYSQEPEKLTKLRRFRDQVLVNLPGGAWFISAYYQWSPSLVNWSNEYPHIHQGIKRVLDFFLD